MKIRILTLFVCVLAAGSIFAQAPGYMGKRFFAQTGSALMFALERPTASNHGGGEVYGKGSGTFGLNTRPYLQLGMSVSRTKSLALEMGYVKTGMLLDVSTPSLAYDGYSDSHQLFYHLSGMEYGLSWQSYNPVNGSLSPMGFFVGFSLKLALMKGKIVDKLTTSPFDATVPVHAPLGIDARYNHWSAGIEFGRHYIIADKWLITLSTELNASPFRFFQEEYGSGSSADASENQRAFDNAAFARMQAHNRFFFKIGAGYLF